MAHYSSQALHCVSFIHPLVQPSQVCFNYLLCLIICCVFALYPSVHLNLMTNLRRMRRQATDAVQEEDDEKGWNLDDEAGFDEEEDEDMPSVKPAAEAKEETMDLEEGGDEIDPLDAFMADNDTKVAPIKAEEGTAASQGIEHKETLSPYPAYPGRRLNLY